MRGLIQTQSAVELRLYVKGRGEEEVYEKRGYPLVGTKRLIYASSTTLTLVTHHLALHKAL